MKGAGDRVAARPTILVTVPNYLPGYKAGGAIRTVAAMAKQLHHQFEFKIVTSDRDVGDDAPYPGIPTDVWVEREEADVRYLSPSEQTLRRLGRVFATVTPDLLYVNGLFHPVFVLRVLLLRYVGLIRKCPVMVAGRGHLSPGALKVRTWRKRIYLAALRHLGLTDGVVFQATNEGERQEILKFFPRSDVRVAPNVTPELFSGSSDSDSAGQLTKTPGNLRVIFLSRIAPKKNLAGALEVCARTSGNVALTIVGPVGDVRYWSRCRELIRGLPGNIEVTYEGPLPHEEVPNVLKRHHLLLLPTRSENFGHVIRESLTCARPVLISDQTPWDEIEEAGAGWICPVDDVDCFRRHLTRCVAMSHEDFVTHCRAAERHSSELDAHRDAVSRNRSLLSEVVGGTRHGSEG